MLEDVYYTTLKIFDKSISMDFFFLRKKAKKFELKDLSQSLCVITVTYQTVVLSWS